MPQLAERGAEVRALVATLTASCTNAGLVPSPPQPIDYGAQLTISGGSARVTINVYGGKKGVRVVVGGTAGSALHTAVSALVDAAVSPRAAVAAPGASSGPFPAGPWIGSDESGKGDYFGPLVVAAVYAAAEQEPALRAAGVRDSKLLDDATARRAAAAVRRLCPGRFAEEILPPTEYNALYARFKAEKQNLNHLLAWSHVHVLDALLARLEAEAGVAGPARANLTVIADKFADERYIRERLGATLSARGATLPALLQTPRAEANVAVAAASILARDRFLGWLDEASSRYGVRLPKGGANAAIIAAARRIAQQHGRTELANVAKLHFATTARVIA